jgi:hypothetical protein
MPQSFPKLGLLSRLGNAVSAPAEEVDKRLGELLDSARRSRALFGPKSDAISAIWDVAAEAGQPDWNGEGALAVDPIAAANAVTFIQTLPGSVAMPEVSPEPDGGISLDWIESQTRVFSVSIGPKRSLPFAWLDGTSHGYGVVSFDGEDMPNRVLNEISRIRINGTPSIGTE